MRARAANFGGLVGAFHLGSLVAAAGSARCGDALVLGVERPRGQALPAQAGTAMPERNARPICGKPRITPKMAFPVNDLDRAKPACGALDAAPHTVDKCFADGIPGRTIRRSKKKFSTTWLPIYGNAAASDSPPNCPNNSSIPGSVRFRPPTSPTMVKRRPSCRCGCPTVSSSTGFAISTQAVSRRC